MDEELGSASVVITLDSDDAVRAADDLGDRIRRALDRASQDAGRRIVDNVRAALRRIDPAVVRITADTRQFQRAVNDLNNLGSSPIRVTPDVDRAQFEAAIQAALAGLTVSVRVVPDLSDFDAAIRAHRPPTVTVNVDADTDRFSQALSRLGGVARGAAGALGGLLQFSALSIAAAGAAQSVGALVAALAPAVGILAAGPAAALGYAAALGSLRLALSGVSDAFSTALTGNAEEFADAIENLSPAAQAAAREVRALKPAFEDLRESVQDAFFEPLAGQITGVAEALSGPLTSGLTSIADGWGRAARGVLGYIRGAEGVANVTSILGFAEQGVDGLANTTNGLTAGFLRFAAAVSDAFGERLNGAITRAGDSLALFLTNAANGGSAVVWVDQAISVLTQLGSILGNIGQTVSGVFGAANQAGAGLLGNIERVTASLAEFANSAQGQEALAGIFTTIGNIAAQLGPIIGAIVTQVGAIAPALAPIPMILGPAITGLINALGPALAAIAPALQGVASGLADALAAVGPALEPLGDAIGNVVRALSPILPVVGELAAAIGTTLAPIIEALASAVAPVVQALSGALRPILPILTEASLTLTEALTPLVELLGATLADVVTSLAPLFESLATVLSQVVTAIAPLIEQITASLTPQLQQLGPIISQVVAAIVPLVEQLVTGLLPVLPPLVEAFVSIQAALLPILPSLAQLIVSLAPLVSLVISAITPLVQFGAAILNWLALNAVVPVINGIVSAVTGIIGAVGAVATSVADFVNRVISFFQNLDTNVSGIVSGLVSAVTGFFSRLPDQARSAVSGLVSAVNGVFTSARDAVTSTVSDLVSSVVSSVRGIPNEARNALGNVSGVLVSAGRDLIRGMINGVRDMASSLANAARDVARSAYDAVTGFFDIRSPSRVMREVGRFIGQGLINGLTGSESEIERTAQQLAEKIRDAFRGRDTTLDNRLIAGVQATTRRLTSLAREREAIAQRIQEANQFAANVTQQALNAFSLQNLAQEGGGVQGITDGIESAIRQVQRFNRQINALAARGLRRDLLSQIIGLGPEQGAGLASTLANASNAQLRELNEAQRQLAAASRRLGRDSADQLFDAGKEASKGFLAGLKDQQEDIEDLMLTIARSMSRSIRNALGIRSPSRVFRQIGRFTMDGLAGGVDDRLSTVRRSVLGAASALTQPFGGSTGSVSVNGPVGRQMAAQRVANRSQVNNITINEVGDAEATAQRLLSRIALAGGGL